MSDKLATLGIERDPAFLYFVRRGEVWRVARPSSETDAADATLEPPELVAETGVETDDSFVYFLDADGDLARVRRSASSKKPHKKRASRAAV